MQLIHGIMWKSLDRTFVLLCFCYFLFPVLTKEASFGIKTDRLKGLCAMVPILNRNTKFLRDMLYLFLSLSHAGHGFYDENYYDDSYAEYTGEAR